MCVYFIFITRAVSQSTSPYILCALYALPQVYASIVILIESGTPYFTLSNQSINERVTMPIVPRSWSRCSTCRTQYTLPNKVGPARTKGTALILISFFLSVTSSKLRSPFCRPRRNLERECNMMGRKPVRGLGPVNPDHDLCCLGGEVSLLDLSLERSRSYTEDGKPREKRRKKRRDECGKTRRKDYRARLAFPRSACEGFIFARDVVHSKK